MEPITLSNGKQVVIGSDGEPESYVEDTEPLSQADYAEATRKARLEYLREQIRGECISYDGIAELQSLASDIEPGDTELLEWAGVPEKTE